MDIWDLILSDKDRKEIAASCDHRGFGEFSMESANTRTPLLLPITNRWRRAHIEKPDFYDERWYKKILPKDFLENSLRLIDADLFLEWLKQRNVKLVLHGHKHIPFISEFNGIHIISCGSSTGQVTHKDRRKIYLSN